MKNNKIIELPPNIIKNFFVCNFLENISYILKELLENSCDAKSSKIIVNINTKKNYIQVIDNGEGIDKDDLEKLTLKYHTNRIKNLENLQEVDYYGFKGQSLHSINLFFPLEIISKTSYQNISWKIMFEKYSHIKSMEPEISPTGTFVKIKNINSLKNKNNIKNLYNIFKIIALSNFNVHFILYKNSKEIFNFPTCKNFTNKITRFKNTIKSKFLKNSVDVDYIENNVKFSGFITFSEKKENIYIFKYMFINNRYVKISIFDDILIKILDKMNVKISVGYCIYLETKLNLSEIILDVEKINVTFKNSNDFYELFYNFINKYISKYSDFFYLDKDDIINTNINSIEKNYTLFSTDITEDIIIKENNNILTILNNDTVFFQLDNKIFAIKSCNLRSRIIIKKCINEFLINNKLLTKNINIIKYYNINKDFKIVNYSKFMHQYGFNFKIINNQTISLISIPEILINYYIDWYNLLNDLLNYFSKSIANYFSKNRFDMSVIKIFINNIDDKSPFLNFEIDDLYKELVYTYNSDLKWFKKNCVVVY